jgi:hypothetical protein
MILHSSWMGQQFCDDSTLAFGHGRYCKLVESLRLRFCVTTDVYFVLDLGRQILAWCHLYTAWVEFPHLNKIDVIEFIITIKSEKGI